MDNQINNPNRPLNDVNNLNPKKQESMKDKIGDAIEKLGHKISDAGAPNLGQKIHDLGDRIEKHHDNPSHPHKA